MMAENLGVAWVERIAVAPEIGPKSFGTFEKQAPAELLEAWLALTSFNNRRNV